MRLALGISFFIHGLVKFQGGIGNIAGWFESIGIPGFVAYVVATIELVGGIALILGIGTRVISALFALIMIGAILTAKLPVGFLGNGKMAGYELDLAFLVIALHLALSGSQPVSLDNLFFAKSNEKSA